LWANLWAANSCITSCESVRAARQCVVIAVLEGSGVDEPLEERYDLCADGRALPRRAWGACTQIFRRDHGLHHYLEW
jgi:hypothetical protein